MQEFKYEIKQELGILSTSRSGWSKEVNLVSWNGKPERIDIRDWSPDRNKMGKGVTLSKEEGMKLYRKLKEIYEIVK